VFNSHINEVTSRRGYDNLGMRNPEVIAVSPSKPNITFYGQEVTRLMLRSKEVNITHSTEHSQGKGMALPIHTIL